MKKLIASILMIAGILFSITAMACPNCSCDDGCDCKPCQCPKK